MKIPKYCLHKASGRAYVKINGRRKYLGPHGSQESRDLYDQEILTWKRSQDRSLKYSTTVGQLCVAFLTAHEDYYSKCELSNYRSDTSDDVWIYQPTQHKNAWRGKSRTIIIGPRGQDVLLPFLTGRDSGDYVFNPHDGRREFVEASYRSDAKAAVRGSKPGKNKPYTIHGYTPSIQKACTKSGVPKWSPGRLRHNAATNVNNRFGDIDSSRVYLGHSERSTTQIYAERDLSRAIDIARQIG